MLNSYLQRFVAHAELISTKIRCSCCTHMYKDMLFMLNSYLQDSLLMLNSYLQTFVIHTLPRTTKIIFLRLGISLRNFSTFRILFYKTNKYSSPAGQCSGRQWDFTDDITILNKRKDIVFPVCGFMASVSVSKQNELLHLHTRCDRLLANLFTNLHITVESETRAPFARSKQVLSFPV